MVAGLGYVVAGLSCVDVLYSPQVKVDSKTRVDLLKYILKKKQKKENETIDEEAVRSQLAGNIESFTTVLSLPD